MIANPSLYIRRCGLAALLVALGAAAATAQVINGTVVDRTSAIGVGTGFVVLMDENDVELVRTLTDAAGDFSFNRVRPGRYRLRSERIGYRATTTPLFEFGPRETQTFRIEIELLPMRLSSIEVREETNCRNRPEEGEATAVLWEEIRKALAGASWTSAQRGYRYRHTMYLRDLDRNAERVESEQTEEKTGTYRTPFLSRSAEELAEHGYAVEEDGDIWFYAPDDKVLQHDAFLSTHCFRVVRDTTSEQVRIGLAFRPERGRRIPDIAGVLWLDERSSELRTLEYEYQNLVGDVEDDRLGGTLDFLQLPNGAWIVYRFQIRMPILGIEYIRDDSGREPKRVLGVKGYRHSGGEVLGITTTQGDSVYSAALARLSGVVNDRSAGRPLAGALVSLVGTDRSAMTDGSGRFVLGGLMGGAYGVTFTHPRLDSLRFTMPAVPVDLDRGANEFVELDVPAPSDVFEAVCPGVAPSRRAIVGKVSYAGSGIPVVGATVSAAWQDVSNFASGSVRNRDASVVTDSLGHYEFCGVPSDQTMVVVAEYRGLTSQPALVEFEAGGVWHNRDVCHAGAGGCFNRRELHATDDLIWTQDLTFGRAEAPSTGIIAGVVTDMATGAAMEGAEVLVPGTSLAARTGPRGSFRFEGVPAGLVRVRITLPGYNASVHEFVLEPGMEVVLPKTLISLLKLQ